VFQVDDPIQRRLEQVVLALVTRLAHHHPPMPEPVPNESPTAKTRISQVSNQMDAISSEYCIKINILWQLEGGSDAVPGG